MRIIFFILIVTSCSHLPSSRKEVSKFTTLPIEEQLRPFKSDGCSVWPEGTKTDKTAWIKCCVVHDIAYWEGGTEAQKKTADENLKSCVENRDSNFIAELMKIGVTIGGEPQYKTSFKWGYGWTYQRGYLPLSNKEKSYAEKLKPKKGLDLRKYVIRDEIDPEINSLEPIIY